MPNSQTTPHPRPDASRFWLEFKIQWFGGAVAMVPGTGLFFWMDILGARRWLVDYGWFAVVGVGGAGLAITALAAAWITRQQLRKAQR
ncbi:hypothetical protein ACOTHJ_13675 [Achromobacter xylosoxidans]